MPRRRLRASLVLILAVLIVAPAARRGPPDDGIETRYTKQEFRIAMRDGVRLYTAVYVPRDTSRRYPFLITRTPFGATPYGAQAYPTRLGPADALERSGYI